MFTCYVCQVHHNSSSLLFRHLKFQHGLYPGRTLRLKCGESGCSFVFCTYYGYKRHLSRVHKDCVDSDVISNFELETAPNIGASVSQPAGVDPPETVTSHIPIEKRQILDMCTSVIAQIQATGVPESTVQCLASSMEEHVNDIHAHAKEAVVECLSPDASKEVLEKVEDCFEQLENPFSHLNTESKRMRHFEEKWKIVEPVEYVLGVRFDTRRDRTSGIYRQVPVNDKVMYVPIMGSLSSMFRNREVCEAFQRAKSHQEGFYTDVNDGSYFRNHTLFSQEDALQIQLYYDDFETANPLGSKKGVNKLGCIYFILRNLPPKLNSVLMNIHLVSLFHSEDLKKYGFDSILKPLVDDLKVLETEGMQVPFSDRPLKGTVFQVTGDNLALHGLFGFVESFSANYCCRFCLTDKTELQSVFSEDHPSLTLHCKDLHSTHCDVLHQNPALASVFGVKKTCLLNSLQLFHTSENYAVDIMHDLLEGVVQYELKLVFQHLFKNSISVSMLSERIVSFNYGYTQRKNRPSGLKLDDTSKDLGLNAVQSWCLLRNAPLMLGNVASRDDGCWNLLLLLIQIVNIVFSPILTHGMTCYLKHLILDHHKLFKSLFPERNLLPKHHLMIHYPSCIRRIGPLIHMWCMRFEGKHNFFKSRLRTLKT